jgi:hypothetical protein
MADKSIVEKFLERVVARKCENGHELPSGKSFCPDCGKPQIAMTLTVEQRVAEMEAVVAELLTTVASPSKKDDAELTKKVASGLKWLVTPQTKTEKK